jgi:hypothetical protein
MTSRFSRAVRRQPLVAFFVLTFAFSWGFEIPLVVFRDAITDTQGLVLIILASNVPSVLGIVLTAVVLGGGAPGRAAGLYAAFAVSVIALSVILTWVYNGTGGAS